MEVRERIRVNGKPLSKDKFAKYFFDCWDNLCNNGHVSGDTKYICICKSAFFQHVLFSSDVGCNMGHEYGVLFI